MHFSSIVKEVIRTISAYLLLLLFFTKRFWAHKNTSQANKWTKNNKGNNFFARTKFSETLGVVCFAFWCFFYTKNFFVKKKKKNRLEVVLIASLVILPLQSLPSQYLPVKSQQYRHQTKVWNLFKVTNEENITTFSLAKWLSVRLRTNWL